MRVLLWHVHGSWTTSFVQGRHEYLLPVVPNRGPDGRGRARTWQWPPSTTEHSPAQLAAERFDVVVLQRTHELDLVEAWTGRRPGRDVPAVYVEHNTPGGPVLQAVHPLAHQEEIPVVHVTHFNRLFWDTGRARAEVVEHGIVDPGYRYTGELERAAVVINDPVRRAAAAGADLLAELSTVAPVDLFGMNVTPLFDRWPHLAGRVRVFENLPQDQLHAQLARRRVYLHLSRWTSLGLSLLEAMQLGMPVAALATTEVPSAVPPAAGTISTRTADLAAAIRRFVGDRETAVVAGRIAREAALARYGLERFLADWDALLTDAIRAYPGVPKAAATR